MIFDYNSLFSSPETVFISVLVILIIVSFEIAKRMFPRNKGLAFIISFIIALMSTYYWYMNGLSDTLYPYLYLVLIIAAAAIIIKLFIIPFLRFLKKQF